MENIHDAVVVQNGYVSYYTVRDRTVNEKRVTPGVVKLPQGVVIVAAGSVYSGDEVRRLSGELQEVTEEYPLWSLVGQALQQAGLV